MLIAALFLLGVGNFALHKAVLESGHPLLAQARWLAGKAGQRISLLFEFTILLAAMVLAAEGWHASLWVYLGYSGLNSLAAWLVLSRRI